MKYLFSWGHEMFLCIPSEKMMKVFFIFNKLRQLLTVAWLFETFCWISFDVHLLWIYFLHQNTWIPGRFKLFFLISGKMTWEKTISCEMRINFSSRTGQLVSTIRRLPKKEHLFYRTPPSGCFYLNVFIHKNSFKIKKYL